MLKGSIVGCAQGTSEREGDPQRSRRLHALDVLADQADAGRHDAGTFEKVADRTHGASAIGSHRCQEDGVYPILFQKECDLSGSFLVGVGLEAGTHEAVVDVCHRADLTCRNQLSETVDRKYQVYILSETTAIEVSGAVRHDQLAGVFLTGNGSERSICEVEGFLVAKMQPGGGDQVPRACLPVVYFVGSSSEIPAAAGSCRASGHVHKQAGRLSGPYRLHSKLAGLASVRVTVAIPPDSRPVRLGKQYGLAGGKLNHACDRSTGTSQRRPQLEIPDCSRSVNRLNAVTSRGIALSGEHVRLEI